MVPRLRLLSICYILGVPYFLSSQAANFDCANALLLCDKSPISVSSIPPAGDGPFTIDVPCLEQDFVTTNSVWFKWQVANTGSLEFSIQPLNENDDVDFVLYRLPNSYTNCESKEVLRCMMAGPVLGDLEGKTMLSCTGVTGLSTVSELANMGRGCSDQGNNFLSPVEVESGESYALLVHNFRSDGGVNISFAGSCVFELIGTMCKESLTTDDSPQNIASAHIVRVYPNPTNGVVYVSLVADEPAEGVTRIFGANGNLMLSQAFSVGAGEALLPISVTNFQGGLYFMEVCTGEYTEMIRFIKQ